MSPTIITLPSFYIIHLNNYLPKSLLIFIRSIDIKQCKNLAQSFIIFDIENMTTFSFIAFMSCTFVLWQRSHYSNSHFIGSISKPFGTLPLGVSQSEEFHDLEHSLESQEKWGNVKIPYPYLSQIYIFRLSTRDSLRLKIYQVFQTQPSYQPYFSLSQFQERQVVDILNHPIEFNVKRSVSVYPPWQYPTKPRFY